MNEIFGFYDGFVMLVIGFLDAHLFESWNFVFLRLVLGCVVYTTIIFGKNLNSPKILAYIGYIRDRKYSILVIGIQLFRC